MMLLVITVYFIIASAVHYIIIQDEKDKKDFEQFPYVIFAAFWPIAVPTLLFLKLVGFAGKYLATIIIKLLKK